MEGTDPKAHVQLVSLSTVVSKTMYDTSTESASETSSRSLPEVLKQPVREPGMLRSVEGVSADFQSKVQMITGSLSCCAKCGDKIEGNFTEALGQKYHIDHFTCAKCNMSISNKEFMVVGGKAYCHEDFTKLFLDKVSSLDVLCICSFV